MLDMQCRAHNVEQSRKLSANLESELQVTCDMIQVGAKCTSGLSDFTVTSAFCMW